MTKQEMNTEIANIALRLAKGVNRWNQNGIALINRVNGTVETELSMMSFSSDVAKAMMSTVIMKTFSNNHPTQYQIVHPKVGMDQNGNYTKDYSKWA